MTAWEKFRWAAGQAWRVLLDTALIAAARVRTASRSRPAEPAVCIVRLDGIGDFVLWLQACRRLVAHHQQEGARVVLVANVIFADWARELRLADEVWDFDRLRFQHELAYRAEWLRRMRAGRFTTVLQPAHSRRPAEGDALVRASGAPLRIGPVGDGTNTVPWLKRWADRWYTRLIDSGGTDRMELLRNAAFMRGLGFADFRARAPSLDTGLPANPAAPASERYAVLIPGGGAAMRAWPIRMFAEVGRRLADQGQRVVLAGGTADQAAAQALAKEIGPAAEDLTGKTTLGALAAMLQDASVVVSNETGAAHMAAAAGAPVVCLMGGGHYGRFMPYQLEDSERLPALRAVARRMDCFGCNWRCIYARAPGEPVRCVQELTLEKVWTEVAACLAQSDPENPGAHFQHGVALQAEQRYDEAHGPFREALRLRMRGEAAPAAPAPAGPQVAVPRTTLACVDCRNHELAIVALRRSMAQCRFERVQFFTDRPFQLPGIEVVVVPDIASIADYSRFVVKELGARIDTDFALLVQYDGYVLNGRRWREDFLGYDYIGAPWSRGGVGNGGFSLRSRKLMQALRDHRITELVPEDVAICETYRVLLEAEYGIRFAPVEVAALFSFETLPPPAATLGFHGLTHLLRLVNMSEEEIAAYRPAPMVVYDK